MIAQALFKQLLIHTTVKIKHNRYYNKTGASDAILQWKSSEISYSGCLDCKDYFQAIVDS